MYGFHKIPHLQQGVLRSDSDTEFWNFEHPHFIRGQPDMLCLIQRKKQAASSISDAVAPTAEVSNKDTGSAGAVGALSPGQLMDMNSIVNGIQAIKRHQAAISADLNELKSSNLPSELLAACIDVVAQLGMSLREGGEGLRQEYSGYQDESHYWKWCN